MSGPESDPGNTVDFRRALKRRTPEASLTNVHTHGCKVLPDRLALLDHLPKGGVVAEVGVADGGYSREILERNRPRVLHLIDLWDSDRYLRGLNLIRREHAALIDIGTVRIHQGKSTDILATFPDASFDWVYIDTDHSYELTSAELRIAAQKVKDHGFIAGHDFCAGNVIAPWPYGVIEACHMFCVEAGWQYRYLTLDQRGRHSFALSRL
jgi:predicted O-methyltransferase YrrM